MSVQSPCIDVCTVNSMQICIGCFRNLNEIAAWSQLNDEERRLVLSRAECRRAAALQQSIDKDPV